jgi:hypothetical protein
LRTEVRFSIKHPHPARPAVLALDHPHHRFQRGHVRAVAVEGFITQREALGVDDQSDDHLFAIRPVIARVAALQHRILFRPALHIAARQVIEENIKLGGEQFAIALLQMLLQFRLVRQRTVQAAVQACIVDGPHRKAQQVIQRRRRIPALLNSQFARGRAQAVDRQKCGHPRPGHIGGFLIQQAFKEPIQPQPLPQFQPQPASPKLADSLEANPIHPHASNFGIVLRRLHVGRKQLQLPALALLVEDFDRLQPARLRRVVQLAQIAQGPLTRTIGGADGLDQRPVSVILSVLASRVWSKKHRKDVDTDFDRSTRGLVCITSTFRKRSTENTKLGQPQGSQIAEIDTTVTKLG